MDEKKIYGFHPVREALLGEKKPERIFLRKGSDNRSFAEILQLARTHNISVQFVPLEKLNRLVPEGNHRGIVALLPEIEYVSLEEAIDRAEKISEWPLVLLLDGVSDVRNFGAIARTAECAGVAALILPAKGGAAVNEDAIKTSAGALLRIPACRVPNLRTAIYYLKDLDYTIIGTDAKGKQSLYETQFTKRVALVMGAEGTGISRGVLGLCDSLVSIPQLGEIGSLNVSAATAVVLYEALRQRLAKDK
ncbi:MAG: 23S rRNA (guanosine(2251)-2'-O)-methyltransferase RlmB [Bacteroidales bacterium]|nr:23S rRNA (guanosine(2251)-2'-O)-methyltransferase RlmB [Bacteroidales bacterium]